MLALAIHRRVSRVEGCIMTHPAITSFITVWIWGAFNLVGSTGQPHLDSIRVNGKLWAWSLNFPITKISKRSYGRLNQSLKPAMTSFLWRWAAEKTSMRVKVWLLQRKSESDS